MPQLLYLGLFVALVATPLLLALFRRLRFNPFSLVPRLTLWVAAVVVLVIAAAKTDAWRVCLGLEWPTWQSLALAILAAVVTFLVFGAHRYWQEKLGKESPKLLQQFRHILRLPFSHRYFLVGTAAVTEEVLYRGYAIGVGQQLLGSVWLACILSVVAFTLAHMRWGLAHLLPVVVATLVFTLLFVFTQNLWACIIAHAIVDAASFLVMPAIMARKRPSTAPHAD